MKRKMIGVFLFCTVLITVGSIAGVGKPPSEKLSSPPFTITITTPEEGNFYAMGAQLFSLPFNWTIILGPITIKTDVTGIDGFIVDFYIDGQKKFSDNNPPFEYPWWDLSFGRHTIEVKLYSEETLRDTDSIQVFKIL